MIKDIKDIYSVIEKHAKEKGVTQIEVYMSHTEEEEIKIREHDLDAFGLAQTAGYSVRLIKDGKQGSSFTEKVDDISLSTAFQNAYNSMMYMTPELEYNILPENDGKCDENYEMIDKTLKSLDIESIKNRALIIEQSIYDADSRIFNVPSSGIARYTSTKSVINSNGIFKSEKKMSIIYYGEAIAKENNVVKTGYDSYISLDSNFNTNEFAESIKNDVIGKLSARGIKSGNYKAVLTSDAMITLLGAYMSLFSSESVQKKMSLLEGKKLKSIASSIVNIYDNPTIENGLGNTHFDSEGVKTKEFSIIKEGVLQGFLYNTYTAKKDKTISTAHALRHSYKSPLGISPHNFILEDGNYTQKSLMENIDNGILITDLMGSHAGVDVLSGDFSLQAEGFRIENGESTFRLSPFIVSGNILTLLSEIEMIASDTKKNKGRIYTPSVAIREISVASE